MPKLPLSVVPVAGEPAASLASRLAARNGTSLAAFLSDMGLSSKSLIDGERQLIDRIADLAGVSPEQLQNDTPLRLDTWSSEFRGHRFSAEFIGGLTVRGCADCLREDAEAGTFRMAMRGEWLVQDVTICLRHHRRLVSLWREPTPVRRYDFAARMEEQRERIITGDLTAKTRTTTAFDRWLTGRLAGEAGGHWLDRFPLQGTCEFLRALGLSANADKQKWWRSLEKDAWQALDAGLKLCDQGEDRLRPLLQDLQIRNGRPQDGPKTVLTALHRLLAQNPLPERLKPFHRILRDHMLDSWPLAPGDEVLGEPVLKRQKISLSVAAVWTDCPPDNVRAAWIREGLLSAPVQGQVHIGPNNEREGTPDGWTVVDLAAAQPFLDRMSRPVSVQAFQKALSIDNWAFEQLRETELLKEARRDEAGEELWDVQAAWHRLDRLLTGAEAVYVTMHGWADLASTARILGKPLAEILEMVQDRRLPRVGKHALRQGFASVLVNLSGHAPGHEMTTPGILAAGKGLEANEVEVLLKRGLSPSSSGTGRRARRAILSLSAQDVAAFEARFISFRELALALRLSWEGLDERLAEHGIETFSDGSRGFRKIYERAAVEPLLRG